MARPEPVATQTQRGSERARYRVALELERRLGQVLTYRYRPRMEETKEDLLIDFEDSPEIPKSGMYKIAYSAEYGQFGGRPYGL